MKYIITIILLSATVLVNAQITTDRPDQTESSSTVGKGNLQIETGFLYGETRQGANTTEEILAPSTLFRFGMSDAIELRFVGQYTSVDTNNSSTSGFSDIELGAKVELINNPDKNIEMAFLSHFVIPTAKTALTNDALVIVNKLAVSHGINERMGFGYNIGYDFYPDEDNAVTYSAALGYSLTDKIGTYIEPYGAFTEINDVELNADLGLTYLLKDHFQLDLSTGFGLSHDMYYLSVGFSWLID